MRIRPRNGASYLWRLTARWWLKARAAGRPSIPRRRPSGHVRHRSNGGHHQQRRVPARSRPCRGTPGARTRGGMNSSIQKTPWIGQSVARLEDPPLVTGRGQFAGDINFPHQLFMRVVRSAHANGRVTSIDTAPARALPGVFAVWTAEDIPDVPPIDFREGSIPALDPYRQPVLAEARARYVGDPVAA